MIEKPLLTLFTSPKPFTNPHIAVIQRNAIRSWIELGNQVEVVLLGEEDGLAEVAKELEVRHIREIERNSLGTPLISSLFNAARSVNQSPLLAYVNADIIFLPDLIEAAERVFEVSQQFLIVGQRWDMEIVSPLDFSAGWQQRLRNECLRSGKLHKPTGSDYFVFPRKCFENIPDFAIGRAGWDNWMVYEARQQGWKTVDGSEDIFVIHQQHDYSHLPGGLPHYHLPETDENVRLAGGKRHIFFITDVNLVLRQGKLMRKKTTWQSFWREVELFPIVHLHSNVLGNLFYVIFHPRKAYNEYRKSLKTKSSQKERKL